MVECLSCCWHYEDNKHRSIYKTLKAQTASMQDLRGYGRGWVGGKGMMFGREQEGTSPIGLPQDIAACEVGYHYGHRPMLDR